MFAAQTAVESEGAGTYIYVFMYMYSVHLHADKYCSSVAKFWQYLMYIFSFIRAISVELVSSKEQ